MLDPDRLTEAIAELGALLAERGQTHHLLAIGGGALLLLGVVDRPTVDLDIVARRTTRWRKSRPLPVELLAASIGVSETGDDDA